MRQALTTIVVCLLSGCGGGCSDTPPPVKVPERVQELSQNVMAGLAELSARLMKVERRLEAFIPDMTGRVDGLEGRVKVLEDRLHERQEWVLPEENKESYE